MKYFRITFLYLILKFLAVIKRYRAFIVLLTIGAKFKAIGTKCKVRGESITVGLNVSIGDFCWIEAISKYKVSDKIYSYTSEIILGDEVAMSDFVHISAVNSIKIGSGTLIGSKVYIGDHSHGSYQNYETWKSEQKIIPKNRPLGDLGDVSIGKNCWIGDNAVILAGTIIGDNCVIGANSVVNGKFKNNVLIAGIPAKILKEYE